jgi:spore germination cell wall hydrolase CwlJ-like protein
MPKGLITFLPLTMVVSCTQPLATSGSLAPVSASAQTRHGGLLIELPPVEFDYRLDGLLRDAALTWTRAVRAARPDEDRPAPEARALDCLTEAVYYEARSEPMVGQRAVAQVVMNRIGKRGFPGSVCGVIRQGVSGGGCQFSFNCDGSLSRRRERRAWLIARDVARQSLSGQVFALVGGATYYHSAAVRPDWAGRFKRIAQIGSQIFYRS